jgi:hypothetical protein
MPQTTVLTADAAVVRDATSALAGLLRDSGRQRFVPQLAVRRVVALPAWRFDRAVVELAASYHGWLRVDWESTAADDAASVRYRAADFHLLSVDGWRRGSRG